MPTNHESSSEKSADDEIWDIAEDYEDKLAKSARGGAKGGGKKRKEKRAPDSKHEREKRRSEEESRELKKAKETKQKLTKVVEGFPKFKSEKKLEDFLDTYIDWLTRNIEGEFNLEIPEDEIKFDFMLSSKKGGQRGDKASTAVRAIHLPTNISVKNEEERKQIDNKRNAVRKLGEKLEQHIKDWRAFLESSKGDETDNIFDVIYGEGE